MKNNKQNIGLKKNTRENQLRCLKALRFSNSIHPRSVLIDATLAEDGTINLCAYSENDPMLEAYGAVLMEQDSVVTAILNSEVGSGVYRLVKGDEPPQLLAKLGETLSFE